MSDAELKCSCDYDMQGYHQCEHCRKDIQSEISALKAENEDLKARCADLERQAAELFALPIKLAAAKESGAREMAEQIWNNELRSEIKIRRAIDLHMQLWRLKYGKGEK